MSWDISLTDRVTGEVLHSDSPHMMRGGTFMLGGTTELWLNITYNYSKIYRRDSVFGKDGIEIIFGKTGLVSIPLLEKAIKALGDDVSKNYLIVLLIRYIEMSNSRNVFLKTTQSCLPIDRGIKKLLSKLEEGTTGNIVISTMLNLKDSMFPVTNITSAYRALRLFEIAPLKSRSAWFKNGTEKARKLKNEKSKRLIKSAILGNADIFVVRKSYKT